MGAVLFRNYRTQDEMSIAAASEIAHIAAAVVAERGRFTFVLAGGNTPRPLYRRLAQLHDFPWAQTHIFWGDERCVPTDAPESNYRMTKETLLDEIQEMEPHVYRMPGELDPDEGAKQYENELRCFFGDQVPSFDCVLLGMGNDGHTASLFPDSPQLSVAERLVVAAHPKSAFPPVPRISLTLPIFNASRTILFLITGKEKMHIVQQIRANRVSAAEQYPAARINSAGRVIWLLTKE